MPRVGERRQRGARGRRRVGQAHVEALGALVHDRPCLRRERERGASHSLGGFNVHTVTVVV